MDQKEDNNPGKTDIKQHLLKRSEQMVDLIENLDTAIESNDEPASKEAVLKLNDIGNELVDLLPNLKGEDKAYGYFMMGSLCSTLRMWPEAADAYETTLDLWPDHVGVLNEYFVALYELQRYEEAIEMMKRSIGEGGETPDIIQNLAVAQAAANREREAKMTLINGMAKFPDDQGLRETLHSLDEQMNAD